MKRAAHLAAYPAARPLNADQIVEFHAARLLLLMLLCGSQGKIHGLTKLAKLDFFVRYPVFFSRASMEAETGSVSAELNIDSPMIRHHYGPWDPRYYQVLAYLEGRELIVVEKERRAFVFGLTTTGTNLAEKLRGAAPFADLVLHMNNVRKVYGAKSGDWLKKLVYRVFDEEVARLARGQIIR